MQSKSNQIKIAVIGGGASGLATAYELIKLGFIVDLYEKSNNLGGLAGAISLSKGRIDSFYHHLFKTDKYILDFLKENNMLSEIKFKRTATGHIWNNKYYDISGILSLLKSRLLTKWGFLRILVGGALIKYFPLSKRFNQKSIYKLTHILFGEEAASKVWNPLLYYKFGKYAELIPYSWLRTRIQDRTIELGYINNGFEVVYEKIAKSIVKKGGRIFMNMSVDDIKLSKNKENLLINGRQYNRAVITTSPKANKIILKNLSYKSKEVKFLGALCGVIEFNKRPLPSYWVGIADTNDKHNFNYKHFLAAISYSELDETWNKKGKPTWPLYLAAYCTKKDFLKYSEEEWKTKMIKAAIELNKLSNIDKINENNIITSKLSFAEYAQPILSPGQDLVPNPESAKYCYFANMHNIFPNDRGQNRSFYLAKKIAKRIYKELIYSSK